MEIIPYFETFINSKDMLNKAAVNEKLNAIDKKYFKGLVKLKLLRLHYGGWEISAKGLKNQWIKAYIIDEGYTFKIYWYNSNEFLRWVATIIMHELAVEYKAEVYSGRNLEVCEPEDGYLDSFDKYVDNIRVYGPPDAKNNLVTNTIPRKIRKKFNL